MINSVSQIYGTYIGIQNCETGDSSPFMLMNVIMYLFTQAINTRKVFLFPDPKWAAGIRKWLCAMDCVNNQPSFLIEINYE